MFSSFPTPLVPTVIDLRLRDIRRRSDDRLFDGWGVLIGATRPL